MPYTGQALFFIILSKIPPHCMEAEQILLVLVIRQWAEHRQMSKLQSCLTASASLVPHSWTLRPSANLSSHFANFHEKKIRADLDQKYM